MSYQAPHGGWPRPPQDPRAALAQARAQRESRIVVGVLVGALALFGALAIGLSAVRAPRAPHTHQFAAAQAPAPENDCVFPLSAPRDAAAEAQFRQALEYQACAGSVDCAPWWSRIDPTTIEVHRTQCGIAPVVTTRLPGHSPAADREALTICTQMRTVMQGPWNARHVWVKAATGTILAHVFDGPCVNGVFR